MEPTVLVLAAGIGSRYGGLKQLDGMGPNGETLMDYSLFDAHRAGFRRLAFVIRPEMEEEFEGSIGSKLRDRFDVVYAHQRLEDLPAGFSCPPSRRKPWGTGHAVLCAAPVIDGPFTVINADDFYGASAYRLLNAALRAPQPPDLPEYCMVGYVMRNTLSPHGSVARGVCRCDDGGYLQSIEELTKIEMEGEGARNTDPDGSVRKFSGDEMVSMNIFGFVPRAFDHLRREFRRFLDANSTDQKAEFYIPTMVNEVIQRGEARLKVMPSEDEWFGVTYREDKPVVVKRLRALIDAGRYPEKLWG